MRLRPRTSSIAAALVAIALAVPSALAAEGGTEPVDDHPLLARARENVAEVTAELEAARSDRAEAAAALEAVESRLATIEQAVNDAAAAVERQELEVAAAAERLDQLREEVALLEATLEERSVELYMRGASGGIGNLFAAGDVREAADRSSFLALVTRDDGISLEEAEAARVALAGAAERFDAETTRLEQMAAEQRALLDDVQQLRETRAAALGETEQEITGLEALEDDLDDDYDRIAGLIAAGSETAVAAAPPSTNGYGWPICSQINSRFGYRWGRQHKGIDLDGTTGTPIAAAKAGRVMAASYSGGYGNLVLIDHGDGVVTAYAHQSQMLVAPGQSVARGELIGLVGNTGNSTGPHLHFETRVNGAAVDPMQYMPDSC